MGTKRWAVSLGRRSPYGPVLANSLLRRVLSGIGISSIGDGLSTVAISWLALSLAPSGSQGLWVSLAVASYNLPGAVGTFALGRWMRGRSGAQLASWDAGLRATFLALIPLAHFTHLLNGGVLVTLLALSSLLNSWGKAGRYVLISELVPTEHRLAGNAVINIVLELAYVAGPPLAAAFLVLVHPSVVIGVDGLTFAAMALIYRFGLPARLHARPVAPTASRSAGFSAIRKSRDTSLLVLVSFLFFLFFGPVGVALPVYVANDLNGSAGTLAGYLTAFGLGGFVGAFWAGYLRRWPALWAGLISVLGVGVFVLPLSTSIPPILGWLSFAIAGLFWGPFPSTTTAYFQAAETGPDLASILAARSALQVLALPVGALVAGPAILAIGPRAVLFVGGMAIVCLAVLGMLLVLTSERSARRSERKPGVESLKGAA